MQFIANLLKTQVQNIGIADVSALGAAYLAGLQNGLFKSIEELKEISHSQRRYVPGDRQNIVQDSYKGGQDATRLIK